MKFDDEDFLKKYPRFKAKTFYHCWSTEW